MTLIEFAIELKSDAEPGTGLGGEASNELIPRDRWGNPELRASHLKGLMRDSFDKISRQRGWDMSAESSLANRLFGIPDAVTVDADAAFALRSAIPKGFRRVRHVTRTAISEVGVALRQSLRTTESIAAGTVFYGQINLLRELTDCEELAWRLALISITAVGANRSRGNGQCVVRISGEDRSPGQLLLSLDRALPVESTPLDRQSAEIHFDQPAVVLELVYRADTPVCFPEYPDRTNVISTGFSVPASAVQGLVLTRLNSINPSLSEKLFHDNRFRAWPLQPCWSPSEQGESEPKSLPWATRVSLTHQIAKYAIDDNYSSSHFWDRSFESSREPYDWKTEVEGAPLKFVDGVLLVEGHRSLWRSRDMPHVISTHGVLADRQSDRRRNLFTVHAVAPMVWRGIVVMPGEAADQLEQSLDEDANVSLGKSRTVRGQGRLSAQRLRTVPLWETRTTRTVLVVQSPLLISEPASYKTAEEELRQLAEGWVDRHGLPRIARAWAKTGIRFGWNRHRGRFSTSQAHRVARFSNHV